MYNKKYLKYKLKYLDLKKKQKGGSVTYESFDNGDKSELSYEKLMSELEKINNKIMVVCYAPWCGHCKKFINEADKYIKLVESTEINIYKVDFTKEGENLDKIQQKLLELDNDLGQIRAFPTLLKIDTKTDMVSQFDGNRDDVTSIIKYFNE